LKVFRQECKERADAREAVARKPHPVKRPHPVSFLADPLLVKERVRVIRRKKKAPASNLLPNLSSPSP